MWKVRFLNLGLGVFSGCIRLAFLTGEMHSLVIGWFKTLCVLAVGGWHPHLALTLIFHSLLIPHTFSPWILEILCYWHCCLFQLWSLCKDQDQLACRILGNVIDIQIVADVMRMSIATQTYFKILILHRLNHTHFNNLTFSSLQISYQPQWL